MKAMRGWNKLPWQQCSELKTLETQWTCFPCVQCQHIKDFPLQIMHQLCNYRTLHQPETCVWACLLLTRVNMTGASPAELLTSADLAQFKVNDIQHSYIIILQMITKCSSLLTAIPSDFTSLHLRTVRLLRVEARAQPRSPTPHW